MHAEIDKLEIPDFKAAKGKEVCIGLKEEYKTLFDIVYSKGEMSLDQLGKELKAKGCTLITTVNLPAKKGLTDPADLKALNNFSQCMAVHTDNLMYFDPERFKI